MKTYLIEWVGQIACDIGWDHIKANTINEARAKFRQIYGTDRIIKSVSEVR